MSAKTLNCVLSVLVIAIAGVAFVEWQTILNLEEQIAKLEADSKLEPSIPETEEQGAALVSEEPDSTDLTSDEKSRPKTLVAQAVAEMPETNENVSNRVMRDISKMMENPAMNEMMQASQRGTLEVMYKDLIAYLNLDPAEEKHFMDLLMARQMFRVETSMKLIGGGFGVEEKKLLGEEMKEYDEVVKTEVETFLNNTDDIAEWEFHEKTSEYLRPCFATPG